LNNLLYLEGRFKAYYRDECAGLIRAIETIYPFVVADILGA